MRLFILMFKLNSTYSLSASARRHWHHGRVAVDLHWQISRRRAGGGRLRAPENCWRVCGAADAHSLC